MAPRRGTGPLTLEELDQIWRAGTDAAYHEMFDLAGEGGGKEAIAQALAQFERASLAIDRTTQSLYISPWSGQTDEPATGARRSRVELTFSRSSGVGLALVIPAGVAVEEETIDHAPGGGEPVRTGRRYVLATHAGMAPGATSAAAWAEAEHPGRGYDEPCAGSLRVISQPGAGLSNERASVSPGQGSHRLVVGPDPDVVIPEHVGQYVLMVAGANAGQARRIVGYAGPDPAAPNGGAAILAATGVYALSLLAGAFEPGEQVEQFPSGARGALLLATASHMAIDRASGEFVAGQVVVGTSSGAQAVISGVEQSPDMAAEAGTAAWRVLDWSTDLGVSVTNAASPSGGRAAMLDELGAERGIRRASGENDEAYASRVAAPADTVSPNAIVRAANRVLSQHGERCCLREVGLARFRGLLHDAEPGDPTVAYAYDMDFDARPGDRFKLALDYAEFRGFFLVGVPPLSLGEFGCAYDEGPGGAYDARPAADCFHDGFPLTAATINRAVWQAVEGARAFGVGFDLYAERLGCA